MRRLPNLLLLFAVIAFAGSCLAWVLMDQSVWPWDEAFYGDFTLQVWRAKVLGPAGWLDAMFHPLFGLMPPLIVWTGQFFVPLRHLTGDFESALLLLNVAASCGALTLIYFISRNITRNRVAALIGMLVCASSPPFVAMTLLYRVEAVQSLTVAVMMFAAWQAARLSTVSMTALLFIGVSLGLLAKASSITFVLPGSRNCTARIAGSSVNKTWHPARTMVSKWCAFRSAVARELRSAKSTRRAQTSSKVSAFAPASKGASRCCCEVAA
jgi:4-amino-4-deoxy-L-arabinose transferase-like glycosyltransferase